MRTAPEHRQRPVAGYARNRFVVVEIVTELGYFGVVLVLPGHQLALQQAFGPQPFAQVLHQGGIFSPALAQNVAHAIEYGRHGGEIFAAFAFFGLNKGLRLGLRVKRRVGKQLVGQRLDAAFACNLPLGAALGLVGQVEVFEFLLGGGGFNGCLQLRRELALFFNAFEYRIAPFCQIAQIGQPRFQRAQLDVVQAASSLLAVAGNERNAGAAVQKIDCGLHLTRLNGNITGNLFNDEEGHGRASVDMRCVRKNAGGRPICDSLRLFRIGSLCGPDVCRLGPQGDTSSAWHGLYHRRRHGQIARFLKSQVVCATSIAQSPARRGKVLRIRDFQASLGVTGFAEPVIPGCLRMPVNPGFVRKNGHS